MECSFRLLTRDAVESIYITTDKLFTHYECSLMFISRN